MKRATSTSANRWLQSVAWSAMLMGLSSPVLAQKQPTPPEHYTLDSRGVDLVTGDFAYQVNDVVIGQPGQGGLVHGRVYVNGGWRDTLSGTVRVSGSVYTVSLGAQSELFTKSGATFTPASNRGATLTQSANILTFTTSDGTVARYSTTYSGSTTMYAANNAALISVQRPNGEQLTYHWDGVTYCKQWDLNLDPDDPVGECLQYGNAVRLKAVSNNYGYQINYQHAMEEPPETARGVATGWLRRTGAIGINLANDYCSPFDSACAASRTWPSATYDAGDYGGSIVTSTDQSGRTTTYTNNGRLSGVRLPGSTSDDIAISYTGGKVSQVTDATGTWNYAYSDNGSTRTTTASGPLGQQLVAVSDQTIGRATSVTDALNRTTSYQYDSQRRLQRVTQPAGDYADLTYDTRGNVIRTKLTPNAAGGSVIEVSAAYPLTCTYAMTCNQPTSTTDARGNVTDYAYDTVHGGVLTVTQPAPIAGAVRPQIRVAYAPQTAWYKNASGVLAAAPSPVVMPVAVSQCATAASCAGTADEVKASIAYGSAGVANNLLPTSTTSGDGTGTLAATTAMTYTANGDVATVDGPLPGADDTTTYRYDNARRPVGVIGPDPDGGSPLLRRAMRNTYDNRSQVTLVEQGTVTGTADADWAAFVSLQQASVTYDAYGRPTHQRQQSGGTTHALTQVGYDSAGRVDCTATRMNPSTFASPPTSACDLGAPGSFGPDRITRNTYDAAGQLISTTSGLGVDPITEHATYTASGKPLTLTDGQGNVSTLEYDGHSRPVKMRYPNATGGGSSTTDYEEYTYNASGNVLTHRNRGGEVFTSGYDALGRQTSVSGGGMPTRTYTYDSLGRMLTASENGGIWTQGYDALSRRVSQSSILGTMTSGYDLAGRRTQLTWPDGFFVNYDYNLAGNLDSVRENGATNWQLANWYYDNLGRKVAQGSANGALSYWAYDGAGRLSGLTHDLPGVVDDLNLAFTYNPAGQIISRTMSNQAYAYAPAQGVTSYVNNGKNQLTNVGGDAVSYDAKGNITQIGGIATQTYDGLNRLTAANTTAGWVGLYYDPLGRLARSIGSTDVMFFYDGGRPIAEYNSAGALTRRYIPGLAMDETLVAYEGASPTDRRWLLADERLSVVAYTDGAAGVLARNTYDEYGQPGAGNGGLFQYTGQMWMPQAQLYHYKARAYAPQMGRFMQTDPIGYGDGANVYGYVGGDPVNFRDPLGREGEHLPGGELQCSLRGGFVVVTVSDTVDHNECHFPSGFLRKRRVLGRFGRLWGCRSRGLVP